MVKRTSNAFYMRCRRQKRSLKGEHKWDKGSGGPITTPAGPGQFLQVVQGSKGNGILFPMLNNKQILYFMENNWRLEASSEGPGDFTHTLVRLAKEKVVTTRFS